MELPFSLPPDFNGVVRLFPLPDLVMFPGNALPLHIFESRYVEMLEDALQHDQLITMATLLPGHDHDYHSRPPIAPVVCISEVTTHRRTDEGTYNLMIVGLQRARVANEVEPVRSFRRASVELFDDQLELSETESVELCNELAKQVVQKLPGGKELAKALRDGELELARLTDILSHVLPLSMEVKLQLLGEPNVARRAELLIANSSTGVSGLPAGGGDGDFSLN